MHGRKYRFDTQFNLRAEKTLKMRIVALRGLKIFIFFTDETRWVVLCCCAMEESGWDSISLLFSLQHDRARCYAGAQSSQERRDILNTTSWNCLLEIGKISLIFFSSFLSPPIHHLSAHSVVERELNVPLPISKIIKKWNNLLQEYKVSL